MNPPPKNPLKSCPPPDPNPITIALTGLGCKAAPIKPAMICVPASVSAEPSDFPLTMNAYPLSPVVSAMPRCGREEPVLSPVAGRFVACHLFGLSNVCAMLCCNCVAICLQRPRCF